MVYRIIGDAAMLVHAAFILYMAIGGFLAWRWPRTFWIHFGCALYGLSISVVGWICPLTYVENWGRERAGQAGLPDEGFIEHYLTGVIYPAEHLVTVQLAVAATVLTSWTGAALLHRGRTRPTHTNPA